MKSLCITGSVQRNLDAFAASLDKTGATAARPAIRDTEISIAAWHRKVLAILAAREADLVAPPTLGRIWEQLAGDIFLANHTQPLWYWADSDSVHVLDFWRDFDPNTCFVLLHTSPHRALAEAIEQGRDTLDALQDALDDWYTRTQLILRFHLRHPARSVLLDSDDALARTGACLEALAQRWQLPLQLSETESSRQIESPLVLYLVDNFLQNHPQALALHNEVQASLFPVSGETEEVPTLDAAFADYIETHRQLFGGEAENASLRQALENTQGQLAHANLSLQDQQSRLAQLQTQTEQYRLELSEARDSLKNSEEENQFLLAQLHQTQEDFEKLVQEDQGKTRQLENLKAEKTALQSQLDTQSRNAAHEKASLGAARDEQARLANEYKAQLGTLVKEKADLIAKRDALAGDHEQQRARLEEAESENELLLLQLHQTQEELEQHLLQAQALQVQLDEQHRRLEKVQARYPGYWDYGSLEASLLNSGDRQQTVQWRLSDVYLGKRLIPELRFKTVLVNGLAGIVIQRTESTASSAPLLRWPGTFADSEELPCIPGKGTATQGSNAALSGLGPTDWDSLKLLVGHLTGLLLEPGDSRLPAQLDSAALRSGLLALEQVLAKWPKVVRYDSIQGQEAMPGNGYEGLNLKLRNVRLGDCQWPEFGYRLATVSAAAEPFGRSPKLEFPESTRNALSGWFAESHDERGPRLELRFAIPDAMDTRVWNALAQEDRLLIGALIGSLPLQIEDLQHTHASVGRSWQDWQALAGSVRKILSNSAIAASRQLQGA